MDTSFTIETIDQVAEDLLSQLPASPKAATVVALSGELGSGKTTLVQAIGRALGVEEVIASPTFVIMKRYETHHPSYRGLVHLDLYRMENALELIPLHLRETLTEPSVLVVVEWPERAPDFFSGLSHVGYRLEHQGGDLRRITRV